VRLSCWIAVLGVVLAPCAANAERRLAVVASGSCPARASVISALGQAMPDATFVDGTDDAESVVVISDGGPSYRALVGGVVRTLVDPASQCEERARKVAIVAVLALDPPRVASAAPIASVAPGAPVVTATSVTSSSDLGDIRLETGGFAEWARVRNKLLSPVGATARLTFMGEHVGLAVGMAVARVSLVDQSSWEQRIPIELALQLRHRAGWIAGAIELGPSVIAYSSRLRGDTGHLLRWEVDARLGGRIELWPVRSYGVFAAAAGSFAPSPANALGSGNPMPSWWFGASAGLVVMIQ
jgi:hypothetical protein